MNLFQSVKYRLETNIDESEVLILLEKNIDQKNNTIQIGFGSYNTQRFIGKIKGNTFRARLINNYRNSFSPVVLGKIKSNKNRTTHICLTLRIHFGIKVFFLFWLSIFLSVTLLLSLSELISGNLFSITYLFLLFPISAFLIFNYLFKKEVKLSKEIFMQIIEAKEI